MKKPNLGHKVHPLNESFRVKTFSEFTQSQNMGEVCTDDEKPLYTGRYLVTFDDPTAISEHKDMFENNIGFKVATSSDFSSIKARLEGVDDADVLIYEKFGLALVGSESEEQVQMLTQNATNRMLIEPELVVYVPDDISVGMMTDGTWGIMLTRSNLSRYSGNKVKVAILDTGFDLKHPDFAGRTIRPKSFVPGENIQDGHGHGTHCIGTACGGADDKGKRYGIASKSVIYAGKVLSNSGRGAQQSILDGIEWAADEGCKVISMSLGSPVYPGQGANPAYERAAKYALSKGCIMVAAAGNDSRRSSQVFRPVSSPANCPSVLSVAAVDSNLDLADFSNRGINSGIAGGAVDITAPGVDIYSSWPMGTRYKTISGTSMATPHIAGILALLWEANPKASPAKVIGLLHSLVQRLTLSSMDVGSGFAIAP